MKLKIALSASFYNIPAVQALLHTCERIYTTQVRNGNEIVQLFGVEKVHGLPDGTPSTLQMIKEREVANARRENREIEFVTFGDLLKISQVTDERLQIALGELEEQKLLVESLRQEILLLQEDQRRLNYLATLGQYEHQDGPVHTWAVTGRGNQSLRDVLDRMRAGLKYDEKNRPVAPQVFNRVPTAPMALSPQLIAAVTHGNPTEVRDPLVQDHTVEATSETAQNWNPQGQ